LTSIAAILALLDMNISSTRFFEILRPVSGVDDVHRVQTNLLCTVHTVQLETYILHRLFIIDQRAFHERFRMEKNE
jgi:glycerol-3-phosphate responsive antiterminator